MSRPLPGDMTFKVLRQALKICRAIPRIISCALCLADHAIALTTYNISFPQMSVISRWLSLLSLDLVVVISLQRAAAVVFPFTVTSMFSQRNTRIIISSLGVLAIGTIIIVIVAFYPLWVYHPYFEEIVSIGYGERLKYQLVTDYVTMYLNLRSGIDLVLIFVSGSLTVVNLKSQAKSRASLKASGPTHVTDTSTAKRSAREAHAIKMSLTVCFVTFVIYTLVILANSIIQQLFQELFKTPLPIMNMYCIFVLNSIGSAFNFFLYLAMSPKYQEMLKFFFTSCHATKK